MVTAILREIKERSSQMKNKVETIYFGGGTPSLFEVKELSIILEDLFLNYSVAENVEFTLECNPDDLTKNKLKELMKIGVNRLSIGIQSFNNEELQFFKRTHDANQAENCVKISQDMGFDNISIDLIYGSQLSTTETWGYNLKKIGELEVPHLSSYGLTVEPNTLLDRLITSKREVPISDKKMVFQYNEMVQQTRSMGFEHYEVSNFSKEGYISRHNSNYWLGHEYLGFGPSAHSYFSGKRMWNVSHNAKYIKQVTSGEKYSEEETIDKKKAFNEYILTRIRTTWGVDMKYVAANFEEDMVKHLEKAIKPYIDSAQIRLEEDKLVLSDQGFLFADRVALDLFF